MNSQHIRFREANIYFERRGQGRPVVFLHGFLEDRSMWDNFSSQLSKHFDPILIDLPGHGDSESLGYVHRMELMADLVHDVLKRLKKRKVVLVGHSMGGYAALAFADKYPDMLNGLVMMNSTSRSDSKEKKLNRDRGIALCKEDHRVFIRQSIPLLFREEDRKALKDQITELVKRALRMNKQGVIAALEGMKVRPSREIILKFPPYPILFISGKQDPIIPWKQIKRQVERSEKISSYVLENGGHMSFLESPGEVYRQLRKFLYQCLP